jgi:hypothetical protein
VGGAGVQASARRCVAMRIVGGRSQCLFHISRMLAKRRGL